MQVEVINCLTTMISAVENRPEAASSNSHLGGNMLRGKKEILKNLSIVESDIQYVGNMLLRNDQHMHRRLWADVFKGENLLILENFF